MILPDKQCQETVFGTPEEILGPTRKYFGGTIPLDPATEPDNPTGALRFFVEKDNGLEQEWGPKCFVNPPYGEVTPLWCAKIHEQAERECEIIALLPCGARFSTGYWQEHILVERLKAICFVNHRVSFMRPSEQGSLFEKRNWEPKKGNNYDSQILGFNVNQDRFFDCFAQLGKILKVNIPEGQQCHLRKKSRKSKSSTSKD